jgi:hypothetical protein
MPPKLVATFLQLVPPHTVVGVSAVEASCAELDALIGPYEPRDRRHAITHFAKQRINPIQTLPYISLRPPVEYRR